MNPWILEEGSGGSSAGPGAATAAALVGFSIGSETGGSIVDPAMRCGVTGLRPTFGKVARTGAMTLCWSLDKLGPMTRGVEDSMLVLAAISGPDPGDLSSVPSHLDFEADKSVKGLRIGFFAGVDEREPRDRGGPRGDRYGARARHGARRDEPAGLALRSLNTVLFAEGAAAFEELTLSHGLDALKMQVPDAWPNLFRQARFLSAVDFVQSDRLRRLVAQEMMRLFEKVDVLLVPALRDEILTITNFTGHPALVVRAGFVDIEEAQERLGAGPRASASEVPGKAPRAARDQPHRPHVRRGDDRPRPASRSSGRSAWRGRGLPASDPGAPIVNPTQAFLAARDFLVANREDYERACAGFRWPSLPEFNWALDYFDVLARGNAAEALCVAPDAGPAERSSFAELSERSSRAASFLRRAGICRGDRMLVMLPNTPPLWEITLAAMKLGAVVSPASTLLTAADLADRIARGRMRCAITDGAGVETLGSVAGDCVRILVGGRAPGWLAYEDAEADAARLPARRRHARRRPLPPLLHLRHDRAPEDGPPHARELPGRAISRRCTGSACARATGTATSARPAGPSTPGAPSSRPGTRAPRSSRPRPRASTRNGRSPCSRSTASRRFARPRPSGACSCSRTSPPTPSRCASSWAPESRSTPRSSRR